MSQDVEGALEAGDAVRIGDTDVGRPALFAQSRDGALIVVDEGEVQDVSCTVFLFDEEHSRTAQYEYPSAGSACAIRDDGRHAALVTLKPDHHVYCYDVSSGNLLWTHPIYDDWTGRNRRPPVTDLSFQSDRVVLHTRGVEAYSLMADGTLTPEAREERARYQRLNDGDKKALQAVTDDLNSDRVERNLKALVEIEVRLDTPLIREHADELAEAVGQVLSRHQLYEIDLTGENVSSRDRKIMSTGKRILYEAARANPALLEPHLPMIRQHLLNQPEQAARSDLEQLRELLPEDLFSDVELDRTPCGDGSLEERIRNDPLLDESAKEKTLEKIRQDQRDEKDGCLGGLVLVPVILSLVWWFASRM